MDAARFSIVYIVCLIIPFSIIGMWDWVIMFLFCGLIIGCIEIINVRIYGKTLSARFWELKKEKKTLAIGGFVLFSIYFLLHLIYKI